MGDTKVLNEKLWNKNFFLLWQGQMVSVLGDVLYMIALNFWIFDMTKSTALMGILSAVTMTPRIILGPFAGVFVDRWDRKKIIIITDLIRGVVVTFVGIAAINGFIQIWMVFLVGIVSGICSAFFNPSINSVRPDIVPSSKLMKANSITSLASSGMDTIGTGIGGMLYIAIGAPYMFLFNGLSYLFSGISEMFIYVPKRESQKKEITFIDDFKIGLNFINDFKVLKNLFISASLLNFFANSAMILLVPYFNETAHLGASKYGVAMSILSLGVLSSSLILSIVSIGKKYKFNIYVLSQIGCTFLLLMSVITNSYVVLCVCFFIGFLCCGCFNIIFSTTLATVVPSEIRGKVMAITGTISMGLTPIGQLIAGVLGEVLPVRLVMILMFLCCFIVSLCCVKIKNLKELIEYDGEKDDLYKLMKY